MTSRHRFLEKSIHHVSFHNRLTEEDAMWRRREHEREKDQVNKRQYRSRSPDERKRHARKHRSSSPANDDSKKKDNDQTDGEFGPPLPSNLGINADRWDHALFMQRYPKDYEKQIKKFKREESTSSDDERRKKKHHRIEGENKKKSKRRHRSRS